MFARLAPLVLLLIGVSLGALAEEEGPSTFDKIWSLAGLYQNEDNRYLQKLALSGRIQPESVWFDSDQGEFTDEFLWRRFRFGFKANLLREWVLHVEGDFDLNDPLGEMYSRLTDAYVGWTPTEKLEIKFLKQSVGFTLDGATSSKSLLTMQRNMLTGNLWFIREYFTGIGAKGKAGEKWSYHVGAFSNEGHSEIATFDASLFTLLSVGRDLGKAGRLDSGLLRVDYVYNQQHVDSGTLDFSDVLSFVTKWRFGDWGLWSDLSAGRGFAEQPDVWGLVAMPFYDFTPRYQIVGRLTFVTSDGHNGVRLPRYVDEIVDGRGNEYREIYLGFNAFFYGHKFKWQTGIEWGEMDDSAADGGMYDGWGLSAGLRLYW